MVDWDYCCSSFLAFRFIDKDNVNFLKDKSHKLVKKIPDELKQVITSSSDIDKAIKADFETKLKKFKKKALLLSGGMDSAILASYMPGCDAYTFRFMGGKFESDELKRAEYYARKYGLNLHYVDINWNDTVEKNLDLLMIEKQCPVHSIEPQIMQAALQAKADGNEIMIIGAASDDVFGGCDKLLSKDWKYDEFKKRFMYVDPSQVLKNPVDMDYAFKPYKKGEVDIDFIGFMDHSNSALETNLSFQNAFETAGMPYFDPYELMKMAEPLDLYRIRHGESKYLIRKLFSTKYPEISIPEKLPMPRPVDFYFKDWKGPTRKEFLDDLDINKFNGNQKWLIYCLERFLNLTDK